MPKKVRSVKGETQDIYDAQPQPVTAHGTALFLHAVEVEKADALIQDMVAELIQKLAKRGVTMGQFATLLEQSTGGRLVIDIRNRNNLLPLADMDTAKSYPVRLKNG